jgi:hypothetical protein
MNDDTTPRRRHAAARRVTAAALVVAVLVFSAPASSWAYWRASTTAPAVALSAATVPAPASISCRTVGLTPAAEVSWPAVTGASSYRVTISNAAGTTRAQTTVTSPTITVTQGLLTSILPGLLTLLLGGAPLYVSAQTIHTSGWVSPASSPSQPISQSLLGVRCGT